MSTGDDVRRAEQMEIRAYAVRLGRERLGLSGALARASMAREREFLRAAVAAREGRPATVERTIEERGAAVRADDVDATAAPVAPSTMYGRFAVFDQFTLIESIVEGVFRERIRPGAFATSIQSGRHVELLLQHGRDPVAGAKPIGKIDRIDERGDGAHFTATLVDRPYVHDVVEGVRADVYGASFRFSTVRDLWRLPATSTVENPERLPERTLLEVELHELGPVSFPAYAGTFVHVATVAERPRSARSPASVPLPDPVTTRSDRERVARTIEAARRGIRTPRR